LHFLIVLIPILLTALGGQTAATLLTVPLTALLSVHSLAAAGTIVEGMSIAQKLEAVNLLLGVAKNARDAHQRLAPLHQAILAKLQDDIARARTATLEDFGKNVQAGVVAQHVGGPLGWGRTPIVYVWHPGENPNGDQPARGRDRGRANPQRHLHNR
jgi:hypothetical protein